MQAIEHVLSLYVYTTTIQRIIPVRIVSSLTRFDFTKKNMLLIVCPETTESKPVKLETNRTVIFPLQIQ